MSSIVTILSEHISRKDKPIGQTFGAGFSASEAIDAAADTYNGVSTLTW